jgi:hypothetical protein
VLHKALMLEGSVCSLPMISIVILKRPSMYIPKSGDQTRGRSRNCNASEGQNGNEEGGGVHAEWNRWVSRRGERGRLNQRMSKDGGAERACSPNERLGKRKTKIRRREYN